MRSIRREKETRYTPMKNNMRFTTEKRVDKEIRKVVDEQGVEREKEFEVEREDLYVEGYAVTFDKPTKIGNDENAWVEVIDRHAFDKCNFKDVCYKYNHGDSMGILGKPDNGSLTWRIDDKGVYVRNRLPDTQVGRDFYVLVRDGYITQQSFAFTVADEVIDNRSRPMQRRITEIDYCCDFSGVDRPAYDTTSLLARSKAMAEAKPDELENKSTEEEELENKPTEEQKEEPKTKPTELENEVDSVEDKPNSDELNDLDKNRETKLDEEECKRKAFEFKKRKAIAKLKIGGYWYD